MYTSLYYIPQRPFGKVEVFIIGMYAMHAFEYEFYKRIIYTTKMKVCNN